jgi:hypothetical protein
LKKNLALAALAFVLLLGAAQSSNSVPGQLKDIQAQLNDLRPRKFYLTQLDYHADEALSVCAAGYHMASLWEIHDPSNLRYDTELGFQFDDSGSGPPSNIRGWIRTGQTIFNDNPAGHANCNLWTTRSGGSLGTSVALSGSWSSPGVSASPWIAEASACDTGHRVWCVQD